MKAVKLALAILILLSLGTYAQEINSEKTKDISDFTISTRAGSINGTLSGPETFNRVVWGGVPDLTCNGIGATLSGVGTNVFYDVYEIYSPVGENLVASVSSGNDSYLLLYCNPFNPLTPLANARFADDDDGAGMDAAFLPADNLYIAPNTSYILVVSSFTNGATFDYSLTVDGGVIFGAPAIVPLSNWPIILIFIGIAAVLILRTRKFI